jgi:Heterokaryon incompatibility protein (HET)
MEDTSIQQIPIQPDSGIPFHIYQSTPLADLAAGQKHIRLLNVYPSSTEEVGDPIQCTMSVVNLASKNHPPFSALSYVWGADPDGTHSVLVKGARLSISVNCHTALQHLRRLLGHFTIWGRCHLHKPK